MTDIRGTVRNASAVAPTVTSWRQLCIFEVACAGAFGGNVVSAILLGGSVRVNTSLAISGAIDAILG